MTTQYVDKRVYRVYYGTNLEKEVFFTDFQDAQQFAQYVNGVLNKWSWKCQIEK